MKLITRDPVIPPNTKPGYGGRDPEPRGFRFSWKKRFPFSSFSHREYMAVARELVDLAQQDQGGNLEVEILAFADQGAHSTALSLSGGQDDETLNRILLDRRRCYNLEEFSEVVYERSTAPALSLCPPGKSRLWIVLIAEPAPSPIPGVEWHGQWKHASPTAHRKNSLSFYGQCVKQALFEEIVRRYYKSGSTHRLWKRDAFIDCDYYNR